MYEVSAKRAVAEAPVAHRAPANPATLQKNFAIASTSMHAPEAQRRESNEPPACKDTAASPINLNTYEILAENALPKAAQMIANTAARQWGCDAKKKKRRGFFVIGKSSRHRDLMKIHGITSIMKVLGIETSCDETAVCLIDAEGKFGKGFNFKILGNTLISQAALHSEFGGVFPNLAKREHAKNLVPLLQKTLEDADLLHVRLRKSNMDEIQKILEREAGLYEQFSEFVQKYTRPDIDAIAVTHGPGLEPALWVGINFARALSAVWNIPIVATNHMEGHLVMPMMNMETAASGTLASFEFPVLALLISGGHTELVLSKSFGEYAIIGQTRDDAAGEAFDKVARLLGLPYPGGPEISRLAEDARKSNEVTPHCKLPRPMIHEDNFDFSFSGLKTAVRRIVENHQGDASLDFKRQIAREFEDAVADVLVKKTLRAVDTFGASTVVVGGGVSANTYIREQLASACKLQATSCKLLFPHPTLSTDNAIMIALAGYFHALKKDFADPAGMVARGNLQIG